MKELIAIAATSLNGETVPTVNARDLHAFLGVGKVFAAWIRERIAQYDFIENRDFVCFPVLESKEGRGGHNQIDYHVTLDMAKELCMVERNEKGKQARQYFIDCERRAKAQAFQPRLSPSKPKAPSLPANVRALLLIGDYIRKVPGVDPALAAACTMEAIETMTGLPSRAMTRALPSVSIENAALLNATEIGRRVNLSARAVNAELERLGLQVKRLEGWQLTEKGAAYGEKKPFHRNGHSGYETRWRSSVETFFNRPEERIGGSAYVGQH